MMACYGLQQPAPESYWWQWHRLLRQWGLITGLVQVFYHWYSMITTLYDDHNGTRNAFASYMVRPLGRDTQQMITWKRD